MHKFQPIKFFALFIFLLFLKACSAEASCPDLSLENLDNEQRNVCEFIGNGKWTIVNIWGPKCPACIEEIPDLVFFHEAHYEDKATVLGIALDFPSYGYAKLDDVVEVVDDYLIDYPILLSDGGISTKLGAGNLKGTPTNLIYDPEGKLVTKHVGIITRDELEALIAE